VNGDGFNDMIFGALTANKQFAGAAYIMFGGPQRDNWSVAMTCEVWQFCGYSVSGAGLVDLLSVFIV
jgi:hypothetical protein